MQINPEPILELYRELGVVKAVADRLGLHYNTVRKVVLFDQGKCVCGKPLAPDHVQCESCLEYRRNMAEAKRRAALKDGDRCTVGRCTQPLSEASMVYCAQHLEMHRNAQRKYDAKMRSRVANNLPGRGAKWNEIRDTVLARDHHACRLCFRADKILHIHHIDEIRSHNGFDNLITLCIVCHATITRILEHPYPAQFLAFLDQHYHERLTAAIGQHIPEQSYLIESHTQEMLPM